MPGNSSRHTLICRLAQAGVTLIELVVFIVVIAITAAALLGAFRIVLPRTITAGQITQGTHLAQERMELILGQRVAQGFTNMTDPCGGFAGGVCTPTANFTTSTTGFGVLVACPAAIDPSTATCKSFTVTVTGPSGDQISQVTAIVTNH